MGRFLCKIFVALTRQKPARCRLRGDRYDPLAALRGRSPSAGRGGQGQGIKRYARADASGRAAVEPLAAHRYGRSPLAARAEGQGQRDIFRGIMARDIKGPQDKMPQGSFRRIHEITLWYEQLVVLPGKVTIRKSIDILNSWFNLP